MAELTKQETGLQKPMGKGFEGVGDDRDLIRPPRIKLLQALSPEVADGDREAGEIINTATGQPIPNDDIIPVFVWREWIKWDEDGKIEWRSTDQKDERVIAEGRWVDNKPPTATPYLHFIVIVRGMTHPAVLSFAKTSYNAGRTMYNQAKFAGGNLYDHVFKLTTVKKSNAKDQKFFVYSATRVAESTEEEREIAKEFYALYGRANIEAVEEDE